MAPRAPRAKAARQRSPSPIAETMRARRDVLFDLDNALPRLVELDVAAIVPNPHQPRRTLDDESLAELATSIEQHGLLQPIVVTAADNGYVLVAGQRRWLAHRLLRRERIAALLTDGAIDELALIENLQREDLDPLDEAAALAALKERHGYTLDQMAQTLAKAKSTISELLSLTRLAGPLIDELRTATPRPSKSVLIELARIEGDEARLRWWRELSSGRPATVRAARARKATARSGTGSAEQSLARIEAGGRQLLRRLDDVTAAAIRADPGACAALRDLHRRLAALLED